MAFYAVSKINFCPVLSKHLLPTLGEWAVYITSFSQFPLRAPAQHFVPLKLED